MKMEEVKVGMTVRLKSGGPLMVVAEVCEVVKCITVAWHDGHRIERHTLSPEMVCQSGPTEEERRPEVKPQMSNEAWIEYMRTKHPGAGWRQL